MFKSFKTASITELRQNATSLVNGVNKSKEPVFILQNSKKAAVLIDDASFHKMMQAYVDAVDYQDAVEASQNNNGEYYTLEDIDAMRAKRKKKAK